MLTAKREVPLARRSVTVFPPLNSKYAKTLERILQTRDYHSAKNPILFILLIFQEVFMMRV